ncbi:MAG: proton-conducting transporter membrane subunit [Patescibacteria group bacterium]|nr:proton-conducting transporter membrane subunit [Patescibacteria group bacterium]
MIHLPVLAIITPLFCAFVLPLLNLVSGRAKQACVVVFATLQLAIVAMLIPRVAAEGMVEYHLGGWGPQIGIVLAVDGFSLLFAMLAAAGIWMVTLVSIEYTPRGEYRYFVLLFVVLAGITGMFFTGDLFNLYVFFELASMAGFPLIAYARTRNSVEAALRYMLYSTIASMFILIAIGLVYGATGTLNLRQAAMGLAGADAVLRNVVLGLLLIGFAIKVALVPFHAWLPEAHGSAPAPVSALLSGVLLKTGVYAIVRLLATLGPAEELARLNSVLLNLGTLSVVVGHFLALGQGNFKKVLAYSSIAHIGIVMTGVGLGTVAGMAGALFHAVIHLFMKATAFHALGRMDMGRGFEANAMRGCGRRAPWTAAIFIISALSLIGLPPLAGFIGKWEVTLDALRGQYFLQALAIPLGTLLSAIYYARMAQTMFDQPDQPENQGPRGGPLTAIALTAGAAGCLLPFACWAMLEPVVLYVAGIIRG